MKTRIIKILALTLCFIMMLLAAGCGDAATAKVDIKERIYTDGETAPDGDKTATKGFRVGFGRTEIMPNDSVPLDSYGNQMQRFSTGYLNKLYITCIAVTDENDTTMLLMTYDITQATNSVVSDIREYANRTYGIDKDYVHLSGTHTHSSVAIGLANKVKAVQDYTVKLFNRAHEAIDLAMADRKVAEIYGGETKTEGLNFVRTYRRADGTTVGDNYGYFSGSPMVGHVKDADETMRIIKFTRKTSKGEKAKDVVLVNWQAHNHLTGGSDKTDIAADFSGSMRSSLEEQEDCYATFFQGCAGNLNETSRFQEENRTTDYREYGKLLAGYVVDVYDKLDSYKTGKVQSVTKDFVGPAIHRYDHLLNAAREILALYEASGKQLNAILSACEPYNIHGNHHATCIVKYYTKEKTVTMPVSAYRIGEIGWTSGPVEFFDSLGQRIRENSPFKLTFTQGYTDAGTFGYMPDSDAYDYGCYESYNTRFEQGAGEQCADQLIDMLKEIHG